MKPIPFKEPIIRDYSIAPYNFVSFPKVAVAKYKHPSELPPHNNFKSRDGRELISGTIEYTLEAKTPIIVSAGGEGNDKYFFKNLDKKYAIPANTIRGIIRTNSQILSNSNIVKTDDDGYEKSEIQDSRFLFRDVAGNNSLSKLYSNILDIDLNNRVSRNLRAGYIYCKNKKYYIEESEKLTDLRNYFRVDELQLRKITSDNNIKRDIKFMYKADLLKVEDKIKELNKAMAPNNRDTSKYEKNNARREKLSILNGYENPYSQYSLEISFTFDKGKNKVTKIGEKSDHPNKGFLLSGGFINGKMSHYVVPAPSNQANIINISEENIIQYKNDLMLTKKMSKKDEKIESGWEFFDLPREGERKPVFFINTDRLHFGFTPYLRMFYSKSVLDGLKPSYKDVKGISYTDSIFGFTNMKFGENSFSYKSRISFEDVVAEDAEIDNESSISLILAEPKATSYNLYLSQDLKSSKKELNIYDGEFAIRGIKQYWLKNYVEHPASVENLNMASNIHPLKEGTIFKGRIHFRNLEEDELGLVLWALILNKDCYQSIGLAKPYGFGRVKVKDIGLRIEDLKKKYGEFSFDFAKDADADTFIEKYKDKFSKEYLKQPIDQQKNIKEFMYIKSKVVEEVDSNWYRYMLLRYNRRNLKEFTEKKVLPAILDYADVIKKGSLNPQGNKGSYNKEKKTSNRGNRDNNSFGNTLGDLANWNKKRKQNNTRD